MIASYFGRCIILVDVVKKKIFIIIFLSECLRMNCLIDLFFYIKNIISFFILIFNCFLGKEVKIQCENKHECSYLDKTLFIMSVTYGVNCLKKQLSYIKPDKIS